ncbi:hypothetical protein [Enterococcus gilvus]|uniref:hypothetical protein n=1 Tax=Enterococcus gilvus TaxID=160453 RepID=UPI003EDA3323
MVSKDFNMYSFEDHIVQIIKKDNTVVTGFVYTSETIFDNDIGDAMNIDTESIYLPWKQKDKWYPTTVFVKDIKDIEIIE